ncbi:MAG: phage scaffolding protein [Lachnospiraceae bacterium]
MKTETLKELGLTEDQIKSVMAENGKDIAAEKAKTTTAEGERDKYKEQLDTAQTSLDKFKDVDPEKLQQTIDDLKKDIKDKDAQYAAEKAEKEFSAKLEASITEYGGKNAKAIIALLDKDTLMQSKNQDTDIKAAFDSLKEKEAYLFGDNEPINNPGAPLGGGGNPGGDNLAAMRAVMGLEPITKGE